MLCRALEPSPCPSLKVKSFSVGGFYAFVNAHTLNVLRSYRSLALSKLRESAGTRHIDCAESEDRQRYWEPDSPEVLGRLK